MSNPKVETIYLHALRAGATGGTLIGSGGGGSRLLFVSSLAQTRVREELSKLIHAPFRIQFGGGQITLVNPEDDFAASHRHRAIQNFSSFDKIADETV